MNYFHVDIRQKGDSAWLRFSHEAEQLTEAKADALVNSLLSHHPEIEARKVRPNREITARTPQQHGNGLAAC
jgi:hypothetical protein